MSQRGGWECIKGVERVREVIEKFREGVAVLGRFWRMLTGSGMVIQRVREGVERLLRRSGRLL